MIDEMRSPLKYFCERVKDLDISVIYSISCRS